MRLKHLCHPTIQTARLTQQGNGRKLETGRQTASFHKAASEWRRLVVQSICLRAKEALKQGTSLSRQMQTLSLVATGCTTFDPAGGDHSMLGTQVRVRECLTH
ncbi:hypothetical protein E2C01_023022 [Portunus trituberculatus]|uniref:Uncharacterized protein n=1 Tax=Portunus trituberculatus TaxID=210409 RepID=A0A5B7EA31_PORTR|nr:hypothetical protein [Portunus trituberculatus]